jgi:nitrogen regulatory protein PII-like uncharacterized protein
MAKNATNPMLFDRRVVERNIKKGLITREDYEKRLAALEDVAEQAEVIKARLGEEEEPAAAEDKAGGSEGEEETSDEAG